MLGSLVRRLEIIPLLLAPFLLLATTPASETGFVLFANHVPGVDAPIYDSTGTNRVEGAFTTELVIGATPFTVTQVASRVALGSGANAGYIEFPSVSVYVPDVPPGGTAYAQVRVFDAGYGWDYDMVAAAGGAYGKSDVFAVTVGTFDNPGLLLGLKSFRLNPPSSGTILLQNLVPGQVDARILDASGAPLTGSTFLAQCFAKISTNVYAEAIPIGRAFSFGTGGQAGYFDVPDNGVFALTNLAAGQIAEVQICVWEAAYGASFDEAVKTSSQRGVSKSLQVRTGGDGEPAHPPTVLSGLEGFRLSGATPGLVDFRNDIPGVRDAPVAGVQAPYVAQLFASTGEWDLRPVSPPAPFDQAGYWRPTGDGTVALPLTYAGDYATFQIRVWDGSLAPDYTLGVIRGRSGVSTTFRLRTGGAGQPPSAPALLPAWLRNISLREPHAVILQFANLIPGVFDAPIYGPDGVRLAGTNYVAQLYAGLTQDLGPIGQPAPFGSGAMAGYWQPGSDDLAAVDVPVGCCRTIQLRIWDANTGATFETATGPRAVSQTDMYFASSQTQNLAPLDLKGVGVIWLQNSPDPLMMVSQYYGAGSWIDGLDGLPLDGPSWVAQIFVAHDEPDTWIEPNHVLNAAKLQPVGPIGPVRGGRWAPPLNTSIPLTGFVTNQDIVAVLRVWESDHGVTYEQAAANGSLLGTSFPVELRIPAGPPWVIANVHFTSSFSIRGHMHTIAVPPGLSLFGNPYGRGPWFRTSLFYLTSEAPAGTMLYIFNPAAQNYSTALFDFGYWTTPGLNIPFGTAFFVRNPSSQSFNLVFEGVEGEVRDIVRPTTEPKFFAVTCTEARKRSLVDRLGFPLLDGDTAFRFTNGLWSVSAYDSGSWSPWTPELTPGEGLFIRLVPQSN